MTTTKPARRARRRTVGHRDEGSVLGVRSAVGEKLRDARELRGVDLHRVERDTKIRSKYLAALEDGDFADLPGDVYARGFLRNYASYLGLDADEIEEEWRDEAGEAKPVRPVIVGPQPMTIHRRVVFQSSHLVIGVVAVIVLVVAAYFGYQLTRYLSYPTLGVSSKATTVPVGTTNYVLTGTATPGTTVFIAWNGQDPKPVYTDDAGHWTFQAVLQSGANQFDIVAKNLDTSHASDSVRVIVTVPTPTPTPLLPEVAFSTPLDGASAASGAVVVSGVSTEVSSVTLTPTYVGPPLAAGATLPPPTPTPKAAVPGVSPGASPAAAGASRPPTVEPTSTGTAADGTFSFSVQLTPGRWQLTLVGIGAKGDHTKAVTRTVSVPFKGVNVLIEVKGGDGWLKYFRDGVAIDSNTYSDGYSVTVVGNKSVCVLVGNGNVYITVNGTSYGAVTSFGGTHAYIDASGPRDVSSC